MRALGIPQAAGIASLLTEAGLTSAAVHSWFERCREELSGLSPATVLECPATFPAGPSLILELARSDADAIRQAELPARWEGSQ